MPRGKRKASFVGTFAWASRDVTVVRNNGAVKFIDKPTNISATYYDAERLVSAYALRDLAHRVIQLTT